MSAHIDWSGARRPNLAVKRVNVDFPGWVVAALDREAARLGVTRQALEKLWIAERIDRAAQAPIAVTRRRRASHQRGMRRGSIRRTAVLAKRVSDRLSCTLAAGSPNSFAETSERA